MALDPEKAALARRLVFAKYPNAHPDDNIRRTLDEPVEQISTADFYNGPVARWVKAKTRFRWVDLDFTDLDSIVTIRDFGKLIYKHLTDLRETPEAEVFE